MGVKTTPATAAYADLEALCDSVAVGASIDPQVAARVRQRAEQARVELNAKGPLDVAVTLVREIRDE
jgi:hypothetical protein